MIAQAISKDELLAKTFDRKTADTIAATTEIQRKVSEQATTPADRQALERVARERTTVLAAVKKSQKLKASGESAAGTQAFLDGELNPAMDSYLQALDAFGQLQVTQRGEALAQAEAARRRQAMLQLALTVLVAAVGLAFASAVVGSINRPLRQAVQAAQAIANGHLAIDVQTQRRDELGRMLRAMGDMAARLRAIVGEVRSGVDSVSTASSQLSIGNANLSQRTEEQAGSLQQTAASMEQLTSTVQQNAVSAAEVSRVATGAATAAARGGEAMRGVVDTMSGIRSGALRIAEIAGVIDGIAFQTNILARSLLLASSRSR